MLEASRFILSLVCVNIVLIINFYTKNKISYLYVLIHVIYTCILVSLNIHVCTLARTSVHVNMYINMRGYTYGHTNTNMDIHICGYIYTKIYSVYRLKFHPNKIHTRRLTYCFPLHLFSKVLSVVFLINWICLSFFGISSHFLKP